MTEPVTLDKALDIIDRSISALPLETIEVMLGAGRVLAEKVSAWVDLPGANISMLDGFAIRSSEIAAAPEKKISLAIAGESSFTSEFEGMVPAESCVKVFAGSVIPEGLDAVVGIEYVTADENAAGFSGPIAAGAHLRKKGEEFRVGQTVADRGVVLSPGLISLCIAAGWAEVKTVTMPRARVIAVGDEIMPLGRVLVPGEVYPSSSSGVVAWLKKFGVTDFRLNIVTDDPYDLQESMPRPHEADVIITLGGTGKSERDVVIDALIEHGVEFLFRGVKAKPGHYTAFGKLGEAPVLCLPGGPSAADMMFKLLGRRAICALTGLPVRDLPRHRARLADAINPRHGDLEHLVKVRMEKTPEGLEAVPLFELGVHREIALAEGIVRVPPGKAPAAGDEVEVMITT